MDISTYTYTYTYTMQAGRDAGHEMCGGNIRAMGGFFFNKGPINCFADAATSDKVKFAKWHRMMLERGVYVL
tara:strand:+ start:409 stop:624 length:216 start_codon:yes stop_codon:yes gene_type:complete